ncbi:SIMPL domain-containing protein [Vulcaniibacterium thermophilum]|uniref:SIMPL domain-containing protein n=1 Tax=Vulcaniibacterium thermophilum TaxID=1169913 RepID=UPI0036179331
MPMLPSPAVGGPQRERLSGTCAPLRPDAAGRHRLGCLGLGGHRVRRPQSPYPQGYAANRSVTVTLHALDRLGEFLDAALAAGLTGIDNVAFESSREPELRRQARDKAIADAREKANGLATAFGARARPGVQHQ